MRQAQALNIMLSGANVFLTGAPGAGKTFVLNKYIHRARTTGKNVAVTASTGIAATHIGGVTIHSWSGLGIRDVLSEWDKTMLASNTQLVKRYNATDVLVIDEVSMLHGSRLDMVNETAKLLRGSDDPFGGMQVILVGDLFQLPPVSRNTELVDFAHTSAAWNELDPNICYITEQHRVAGEDGLLDLLTAMRRGELETMHQEMLQSRLGQHSDAGKAITRLYSHNIDVDAINARHLLALKSESHTYHMRTKGAKARVEGLIKSLLAPEELVLKIGAEVMFVANDFATGFVNGSRGVVVGFENSLPLVKSHKGKVIKVEPYSWTISEDGRVKAEAVQLPLRLAWAITIHKSQGMSLDAAEIDLSKSFTPGMGYVALSRVRSLEGLYLAGINAMALQLHPDIYEFDRRLMAASSELAATTLDYKGDNEATSDGTAQFDEALFQKLRAWRLEQAKREHVAPFMVAHDATLQDLAARPPENRQQLMGTKGFGPTKVEKYSTSLLGIITAHNEQSTSKPVSSAWQKDEDAMLLAAFKKGVLLADISQSLDRTPDEIWQRLQQLLLTQ
ncbi:MAG TPA: HRDC domain-containing protein [Candidatus Saccharimonadales bacterium]|nr:HRDC domain-containing protein [Candidatus Saccharimonadales bacterium]